jgi:predicted TIM-barrel enzyme
MTPCCSHPPLDYLQEVIVHSTAQAEASAGKLLRYRKYIGAEDVKVMADVKKKHSAHAITAGIERMTNSL